MAELKPITTNLFSFKTFRSPDKIDFNEKEEFFIHHPNVTLSAFNKCPIPEDNGGSTGQLDAFMRGFKPLRSYKEIRAQYPELYDYSCQLMLQRKNDSSKRVLNAPLPQPLADTEILKVWDELFVQTATQNLQNGASSVYSIDHCAALFATQQNAWN
jgi:hypothetical protein